MASITEQVAAAHAAHDPHGFKAQGANSARHAEPAVEYKHQRYPLVLWQEKTSATVRNAAEEADARERGFSEKAPDRSFSEPAKEENEPEMAEAAK